MNQHWIEDLRFSIENFDRESGNLLEWEPFPSTKHPQAARNCFLTSVQIASARSRLPRARVMILSACAREIQCFRAKMLTS
jgi:hypothetical protein